MGDEFEQSIEILDSEGRVRFAKPPLRVIVEKPEHVSFAKFVNVIFDKPGTYFAGIKVNGVLIEQVPFVVTE